MNTPLARRCPGPLDRRTWLKVGALSCGSLFSGGLPSLAQLLAREQSSAGSSAAGTSAAGTSAAGTSAAKRDFSVILFWANGGPSHLDLFDLKPAAPAEYRGPFRPIRTNVPGIEITELLPKLSRLADKFALVRSLHHERAEHSGGTHRFLSGYPSVAANLADAEFPELGSVVAKRLDDPASPVPTFVGNTKLYGGGPAYLGRAYAPYMPSPDPLSSSGNNTYDPVPIFHTATGSDDLAISADGVLALQRRRGLLQALDTLPRLVDQGTNVIAADAFQRRALEMLASSRTREAFDLSLEHPRTRERYGNTHWGKSLLTCRRLVEAGVRFVQCQAGFRLKAETGRTSNWDDHSVNSHIFKAYEEKLPSFDQSVSALVQDLHDRRLDDRVLFIFCGEFGRTPRIRNQDASGRPGRDHWPRAMSVFLSGGGLRMGQVIGATSRRGEEPVENIMDSNCLLATLYHRFGINITDSFENLAGRPIPILPQCDPIRELL